jgi:hypothetical protein
MGWLWRRLDAKQVGSSGQWGDFPWESGANTHRKTMGAWPPSFSGLKNRE